MSLYDNLVVWVYFRYEGAFRFCKKYGRDGHCIMGCLDSNEEAKLCI